MTVSGEEADLAAFVEAVRTDEQPLSFTKIVPEPSDEELRKLETYKPCTMCGAYGTLPETPEQAEERGARWYDWMNPAERENRTCNVCSGSKEERVGMEGWYEWRCAHWGTKWDASFDDSGPFLAIGQEGMDVDVSKSAQVATVTPTVAVYKFDTAWAPPAPVVEAASEKWPDLRFVLRYGEPGEGFAGEVVCEGGIRLEDNELDIDDVLAPEEMWF